MGQKDIPLNTRGRQQALHAKEIIKKYVVTHVFHSPLKRAAETADIITQGMSCNKMAIEELKEWHFGSLEGTHKETSGVKSVFENIYEFSPPDGESWDLFSARAIRGINQALVYEGQLLVVAHSGIFAAISHYAGYEPKPIDNCSVFYCEPLENCWRITQLP
jgi:broad specificity phosphatase PhoE